MNVFDPAALRAAGIGPADIPPQTLLSVDTIPPDATVDRDNMIRIGHGVRTEANGHRIEDRDAVRVPARRPNADGSDLYPDLAINMAVPLSAAERRRRADAIAGEQSGDRDDEISRTQSRGNHHRNASVNQPFSRSPVFAASPPIESAPIPQDPASADMSSAEQAALFQQFQQLLRTTASRDAGFPIPQQTPPRRRSDSHKEAAVRPRSPAVSVQFLLAGRMRIAAKFDHCIRSRGYLVLVSDLRNSGVFTMPDFSDDPSQAMAEVIIDNERFTVAMIGIDFDFGGMHFSVLPLVDDSAIRDLGEVPSVDMPASFADFDPREFVHGSRNSAGDRVDSVFDAYAGRLGGSVEFDDNV